jgi:hypothetical protein
VGEADEAGGLGTAADARSDHVGGLGDHRGPWNADARETKTLGDGGVVEADERRQRCRRGAAMFDHGFGQAIVAGEDASWFGGEYAAGLIAPGFDEPGIRANYLGAFGVCAEAGDALHAARVFGGAAENGEATRAPRALLQQFGGAGASGKIVGRDRIDVGAADADRRAVVQAEGELAGGGGSDHGGAALPRDGIEICAETRRIGGFGPIAGDGNTLRVERVGQQRHEVGAEAAFAFGARMKNQLHAAERYALSRHERPGGGASAEESLGLQFAE